MKNEDLNFSLPLKKRDGIIGLSGCAESISMLQKFENDD
jgi:hypothetical protein